MTLVATSVNWLASGQNNAGLRNKSINLDLVGWLISVKKNVCLILPDLFGLGYK